MQTENYRKNDRNLIDDTFVNDDRDQESILMLDRLAIESLKYLVSQKKCHLRKDK